MSDDNDIIPLTDDERQRLTDILTEAGAFSAGRFDELCANPEAARAVIELDDRFAGMIDPGEFSPLGTPGEEAFIPREHCETCGADFVFHTVAARDRWLLEHPAAHAGAGA